MEVKGLTNFSQWRIIKIVINLKKSKVDNFFIIAYLSHNLEMKNYLTFLFDMAYTYSKAVGDI